MQLDDLTVLAHNVVKRAITNFSGTACLFGDFFWPLALDCTAGNGHDTLFLAQSVGPSGKVMAFDIQQEALNNTGLRLDKAGLSDRVVLRLASHDELESHLLPGWNGNICAAMYNLGYLPGGPEGGPVTRVESTLRSLGALTDILAVHGVISIHCYTGHAGGSEECLAVSDWCASLPWEKWRVGRYELCNKRQNREILFLANKRRLS